MPRPRTLRPGAAIAIAVLAAAAAVRCVRSDELHCENAVAQLKRCCPEFPVQAGYCTYDDSCGVVYPSISEDDATCIAEASCEELVQGDVCTRAAGVPPRTDAGPGPDLCP